MKIPRFNNSSNPEVDEEIDHVLEWMRVGKPGTEEYESSASSLRMLYEARAKQKALYINPETLIAVGGQVLMLLIMLNFEQLHVVSSKAFGWIKPPRI